MHTPIELRPAVDDDRPFMYRLFAQSCEDELGLGGWDGPEKPALFAMQFEAQSRSYRDCFPDSGYQIILAEGRPIGRIFVDRGRDAIRVVDIGLLPEWRNRGIGGRLLRGVIDEAARAGKAVQLSVRDANPALRLYRRLGFSFVSGSGLHSEWEWPGSSTPPPPPS